MRIAFLADPLDHQYGGIHTYTKAILHALSHVDQKNEYLIVRSKPSNEFIGLEELVIPYRSYPGYRFQRLFFELPQLMVEREVDLVVEPAHFGPFNLPEKIKRLTVIHDLTMFLFPQHHVFLSQFLQRKCLPRILKNADHIVTNSEHTTKDLIQFFPFAKAKTTSILLGKDPVFVPRKEASVLHKYKISAPYILNVGTLEPRKNIVTLIRAFDQFKTQTNSPHRLVLVGKKGWKTESIFNAIEASPFKAEIQILGYVEWEDLPMIYSLADFFVYPSIYEGFGLPVLEAMACGTPVIASNGSSLPEVGGTAIQYFSPESVEELTQQMMRFGTDASIRTQCSQNGLAQAAKFSWEKAAREMVEVFNRF